MDSYIKNPNDKSSGLDLEILQTIRSPLHSTADDSGFSELYHTYDGDDVRGHIIDSCHLNPLTDRIKFSTPCKSSTDQKIFQQAERPVKQPNVDIPPFIPVFQDCSVFSFEYSKKVYIETKAENGFNKENIVSCPRYDKDCPCNHRLPKKMPFDPLAIDGGWQITNDVSRQSLSHCGNTILTTSQLIQPRMPSYNVRDFYGLGRIPDRLESSLVPSSHKTIERVYDYRQTRDCKELSFPPKSVLESSYYKQMSSGKDNVERHIVEQTTSFTNGVYQDNYTKNSVAKSNASLSDEYLQPTMQITSTTHGLFGLSEATSQITTYKTLLPGTYKFPIGALDVRVSAADQEIRLETSYSDISEPESDSKETTMEEKHQVNSDRKIKSSNTNDHETPKYSGQAINELCSSATFQQDNREPVETRLTIPKGQTESNLPRKCQHVSNNRRIRKLRTPMRSPSRTDPRFRGVTMWIHTEVKGGLSRLNISAFYSNVRSGVPRKPSPCEHQLSGSPQTALSPIEPEPEYNSPAYCRDHFLQVKVCASCRTRRTPLWRDAEDGTPLCNACGIR